MPTKTDTGWVVASESFVGELPNGKEFIGRQDGTVVRSDSPAARHWPTLFKSAPAPSRSPETTGWLVANQAFVGQLPDGTDFIGRPNVTRIRADSVPAKLWPKMFKPMDSSYVEVEAATAGPGERRA
jgi:hypothetical protein